MSCRWRDHSRKRGQGLQFSQGREIVQIELKCGIPLCPAPLFFAMNESGGPSFLLLEVALSEDEAYHGEKGRCLAGLRWLGVSERAFESCIRDGVGWICYGVSLGVEGLMSSACLGRSRIQLVCGGESPGSGMCCPRAHVCLGELHAIVIELL
ncbi:hypothetical protein L7F22_025529 [Adiantum nelumboides]|nr:hypothetical protein [Adiantum nelumboides]